MAEAEQACAQLSSALLLNPNVSLIDIGLDDNDQVVLRVHLRTEAARLTTPVPKQVNGFNVLTLISDYHTHLFG